MKKVVLKVEFQDDKTKIKAMKTISGFAGVESISVDMRDRKMILSGYIDPVSAACRLRKWCHTEIVSVGPAKEEKVEPAKVEPAKVEPAKEPVPVILYAACPPYYHMTPPLYCQSHYYATCYEENPSGCAIC